MSADAGRDDRTARRAVFVVWAAMLAAAIAFVGTHGSDVPYMDDWELVPVLAGGEPVSATWLWAAQNEHRFPLTKILLWAAARATGGDPRAGMALVLAVLGAAGLALVRTARRLRGRASLADAFFPLALLHWGHHENLIWSVQLHFVAAVGLLLALAVALTTTPRPDTTRRAAWVCALTAALLLHTSTGLVLGAVVTARLAWLALRGEQGPGRRVLRVGVPLLALLALVLGRGLLAQGGRAPNPGAYQTLQTTLQFLSSSLGTPTGWTLWPWAGLALVALVACTLALLAAALRQSGEARARAANLLTLLAATGALALAIGWGRAHKGWEAGFAFRYVTLATPVLVLSYLAWLAHGSDAARRRVTGGLCLVMLVLLVPNTLAGLREGGRQEAITSALQGDIEAGVPPAELARRHAPAVYPDAALLAERLELMRRNGTGPYR